MIIEDNEDNALVSDLDYILDVVVLLERFELLSNHQPVQVQGRLLRVLIHLVIQ